MVVRIAGKRMDLWRVVDHESEVLDMLVQRRRDSRAALRLMARRLQRARRAPPSIAPTRVAAAHAAVDAGRNEAARNRRAQQQVIDAQPGVAGKRIPENI